MYAQYFHFVTSKSNFSIKVRLRFFAFNDIDMTMTLRRIHCDYVLTTDNLKIVELAITKDCLQKRSKLFVGQVLFSKLLWYSMDCIKQTKYKITRQCETHNILAVILKQKNEI
jgi:hypothetical protein